MDKARPGFAEDLKAIQGEVEADVGTILEMAKHKTAGEKIRKERVEETAHVKDQGPRSTTQPKPRKHSGPVEEPKPQLLQNVTTRLTVHTNELLTEAALRQRLSKVSPATRQDIIEVALREWLQRNAYGP